MIRIKVGVMPTFKDPNILGLEYEFVKQMYCTSIHVCVYKYNERDISKECTTMQNCINQFLVIVYI